MLIDRLIRLPSQRQPTRNKVTARQTRLDASLANGRTLQGPTGRKAPFREPFQINGHRSYPMAEPTISTAA
jgi:hypothetical protein